MTLLKQLVTSLWSFKNMRRQKAFTLIGLIIVVIIIAIFLVVVVKLWKSRTSYEFFKPVGIGQDKVIELTENLDYFYNKDFSPSNVMLGNIKIGDHESKIDEILIKEKSPIVKQKFPLLKIFGFDIIKFEGEWIHMKNGIRYFVKDSIVKEMGTGPDICNKNMAITRENLRNKFGEPDRIIKGPTENTESYYYTDRWLAIHWLGDLCTINIGKRIKN